MRFLKYINGGLLLALALVLFLVNLTSSADLIWPHEPIFGLSAQSLFWIVGGAALAVSLCSLFGNGVAHQAWLPAWFATNLLIYQLGIRWEGCPGLTGYLGGFSHTFGISAKTANVFAVAMTGGLLVAGYGSVGWLWQTQKSERNLIRMFCPACGGHIKFNADGLGQNLPCPHCQTVVVLRQPENLKISCYFCKEHIEFPAHALGTKISCPHCKRGITLQLERHGLEPTA